MKRTRSQILVGIQWAFFLVLLVSCAPSTTPHPPIAQDELLPTDSPSNVSMDTDLLDRLSQAIPPDGEHQLHSFLVVKNGKLIFEEYYNGYTRDNPHDLRSVTKSITSLLTGIAVDKGYIQSADDSMMTYLQPSYPDIQDKNDITLRHLLTMRSGLECDDRNVSSKGQEDRMYLAKDWVRYFLDLGLVNSPGEVNRYCTGGVVALGEVIHQALSQDVADFADQYLFAPLGIRNYQWARFDDGHKVDTGGHLLLTSQGMAKLGMLVLQEGRWEGKQIVSTVWIQQATHTQTRLEDSDYGFLWWLWTVNYGEKPVHVIAAAGNGGQFILIVPEFELVTVTTAGYYNSDESDLPLKLFFNFVLPAVKELKAYL
jgi:CubicO group peptidase (beta-lactamase class C family)